MALETCAPATDLKPTTATLNGQADNIPPAEFLRFSYSTLSGGPYTNTTPNIPGDNSAPQVISAAISGLENNTTYYYVLDHVASDGTTIINSSTECSFTTTASFNPECAVVSLDGQAGIVTISATADFVPPESNLELAWGNVMGGPYPNVCASVPGDGTEDQTIQCVITSDDFPPCEIIYFEARVTNIPAEYLVDWQYAHAARTALQESAELRLGDEADYPANQTIVDAHVANGHAEGWTLRQGTFPVPSGTAALHMGFISTSQAGSPSIGNFLDDTSIILRTAGGTIIGEQIVNGGFEVPVIAAGTIAFPNEATPGIAWETTDPCNCLELWTSTSLPGQGHVAFEGNQYVELNAFVPAELFQVVPLDTKNEESTECEVAITQVECLPAADITDTTATLNGLACGIWRGTQTRFEYGPCAGPRPFQNATPWVFHDGTTDQELLEAVIQLDCNTDICYRVVASFGDFDDPISISDECQLTTGPCRILYCGMLFDPDDCILVDPGNGDPPYFYCIQF